jgi:hypothetical protein
MTGEIARLRELLAARDEAELTKNADPSNFEKREEFYTLRDELYREMNQALPALLDRAEAAERRVAELEGPILAFDGDEGEAYALIYALRGEEEVIHD